MSYVSMLCCMHSSLLGCRWHRQRIFVNGSWRDDQQCRLDPSKFILTGACVNHGEEMNLKGSDSPWVLFAVAADHPRTTPMDFCHVAKKLLRFFCRLSYCNACCVGSCFRSWCAFWPLFEAPFHVNVWLIVLILTCSCNCWRLLDWCHSPTRIRQSHNERWVEFHFHGSASRIGDSAWNTNCAFLITRIWVASRVGDGSLLSCGANTRALVESCLIFNLLERKDGL